MPGMPDASVAPPPLVLLRMVTGSWTAQALHVAAKLGIADLLRDGPQPVAALAEATGTHAPALYRVLRALAGLGVFAEDEDGRFRLTPLAEPLLTAAPGSVRAFAVMMGEPWIWQAWGDILHSVRTGQPAFDHVLGVSLFQYCAEHPEAARIFDAAMTSRGGPENAAVVAAYDFSEVGTVVDIGGGQGTLLAAILEANPAARGVLLDQPHVVASARETLEASGQTGRCEFVTGDFFTAVPAGGDVYLLKKIIHDWDDERARSILRICRAAIPETGRLLVVEPVVPPGNAPSFAKLLDLQMLVLTGGRDRTEAEHRDLLASAGFELRRIVATGSTVSLLEAVPS